MRVILASQSQFRRHALAVLGIRYETISSNFDEPSVRHEDPYTLAMRLSESKAKVVGVKNHDAVVIAADALVVYKGVIYEKPRNLDEAGKMLEELSGNSFEVITGLAVYCHEKERMLSTAESCCVRFRELSSFEISDYISRYPVLKCAGAFEADGMLRFSEHVDGNYNFKAAIPVNKLIEFLREQGIRV